jgi:hypothetical protein
MRKATNITKAIRRVGTKVETMLDAEFDEFLDDPWDYQDLA